LGGSDESSFPTHTDCRRRPGRPDCGAELARRGIASRIIDNSALPPINESRALAVNQRTNDLLGLSGVHLID
jgi:hypothetical protein